MHGWQVGSIPSDTDDDFYRVSLAAQLLENGYVTLLDSGCYYSSHSHSLCHCRCCRLQVRSFSASEITWNYHTKP